MEKVINLAEYRNKIKEDNKIHVEVISEETIIKMNDDNLFNTIDFLQEQVNLTEDIEEKDALDYLLTIAIHELKTRYAMIKGKLDTLSNN